MADDFVSDEEQYADESFENDSESEVPDAFDASSYDDNDDDNENDNEDDNGDKHHDAQDPDLQPENNIYAYTRKQLSFPRGSIRNMDYVPYTSSSDDDTDVVISKTIAEINPQPMLMDVAMTPKTPPTKSAMAMEEMKVIVPSPKAATKEEDNEEVAIETDESESESESASEQELQITEKLTRTENARKTTTTEEFSLSLRTNISHYHNEQESTSHDVDNENEEVDDYDDENNQSALSPKYCVEHHLLRSNESTHRDLAPDYYADENEEVFNTTSASETEPNDCAEPRIEFCISSRTPSNFNSEDYAFHMNFMQKTSCGNLKLKSGQRKSWSFSNERVREIDRQNQILLRKILTQKPTYSLNPKNSKTNMQNRSVTNISSNTRQTTAAVNRKKQQRQIDLDNQLLKRKIEAISSRRPNGKN